MINKPVVGRKVRFALVGCGRIAQKHFDAFRELTDECELVDVCDTDLGVLDAVDLGAEVGRQDNLTSLLAETTADVVILTTPSGLHPAQAIQVARSGRHVVTEKPMATRWADAIEMVSECDKADVELFVVKQNRFNPTLQLLRRAVQEHRFGRLHLIHVNVFWTRPQEYYDSADWRGTWELDGGALMNQASHYVDLLSWLGGPIQDVHAMTGTLSRQIEVEDSAVLNVRWRTGTLGSMAITMLTYPKNLEGSLTILGDKGSVRIGGVALNEVGHWAFAEPAPYDNEVVSSGYSTNSVYGHGHLPYYRNVLQALRGERAAETDGREGLRSLEVLTAAYLSARDRRTVSLPLNL